MNPKVMVMIPACNEEKTVGEVVKSTKELFPDYKILVIDDGSTDKTVEYAKEAGADVISLPYQCAGGVVIQLGYTVAENLNFDYVVKIDADGQHKPEEIPLLLNPLVNDEADITVGSRYLHSSKAQEDSLVKNGGRVFSSTLVSLLHDIEVTDITSGMRAWNRKALQELLGIYGERKLVADSVLWMLETILVSKNGLRLKEVPIEVLPRKYGKSKSFSFSKMFLYPLRLMKTLLEV